LDEEIRGFRWGSAEGLAIAFAAAALEEAEEGIGGSDGLGSGHRDYFRQGRGVTKENLVIGSVGWRLLLGHLGSLFSGGF
jgi:hypothetical protein